MSRVSSTGKLSGVVSFLACSPVRPHDPSPLPHEPRCFWKNKRAGGAPAAPPPQVSAVDPHGRSCETLPSHAGHAICSVSPACRPTAAHTRTPPPLTDRRARKSDQHTQRLPSKLPQIQSKDACFCGPPPSMRCIQNAQRRRQLPGPLPPHAISPAS